MIEIKEEYFDKKVSVKCKDGITVTGVLADWTSAAANEPDPESITVDRPGGYPVEIYVKDIETLTLSK